MIRKVLVANRGEIAMRILRTLKKMDIKSVAVHSTVDAKAMHVNFADESVCIGPASAELSYNNIKNIISAAILTGADAIHPGYGFLSENAEFAEIVENHGIKFLGPTPDQIKNLGNKIFAKHAMENAGILTIPGTKNALDDENEAYEVAKNMPFPLLLKATDCGGGRGQRIVDKLSDLKTLFVEAANESFAISGCKKIYIESYFASPRHIEFQVVGDGNGNVISLGTRDCSVQRRHQKVLEEAPANISKKIEADLTKRICKVLGKFKYRSAGTVEFLEYKGNLYFIEMNTRVQVEHPVTEAITGIDIIKLQIDLMNGKPLPKQSSIIFKGHAIESRITAEDPFNFTPNPGKIENFVAPGGPNVRVDSAIYPNWIIPPWYDSLAAKIISYGETREECIKTHVQALKETSIVGIKTSLELHLWLMKQEEFEKEKISTQWLEKILLSLKVK